MKVTDTGSGNSLASKLRLLRAQHGYTQLEVSKAIDVSQQMYSRYEKGTTAIDAETLRKICKLYRVSADDLLDLHQEKEPKHQKMAFEGDEAQIERIINDVLTKMERKK